uniref:Uncharacterized protein n=1 Tax=Cannabis sativa TaxID=3483 RepID=A0A803QQ52_CANSA
MKEKDDKQTIRTTGWKKDNSAMVTMRYIRPLLMIPHPIMLEDINLMLEEMRSENYAEASIYLILPGALIPLEWREDVDAIKHVPEPSQTLRRCKIEELLKGSSRVADVVVNPPDQNNKDDYFYNMFVAFGKDQNPDWEIEEEYNAFLERLEDLGGNESDDEIIQARSIFDVEP